jgi:hypothetical protein
MIRGAAHEMKNKKCQMTYGKSFFSLLVGLSASYNLPFGLPGGDLNQGSQSAGLAILKSYSTLHYL